MNIHDMTEQAYKNGYEAGVKSQRAEIEKFENIKATINEFWDILLKFKVAKRKETPTLEEFAEAIQEIQDEAIKEFEKRSEKILIELYEKYHKIANKPKKETDMFYQGRAEAIWECITINRNLVKEMVGE